MAATMISICCMGLPMRRSSANTRPNCSAASFVWGQTTKRESGYNAGDEEFLSREMLLSTPDHSSPGRDANTNAIPGAPRDVRRCTTLASRP